MENKRISNLFINAINMGAVDKLSKNDLTKVSKALGVKKEEWLEGKKMESGFYTLSTKSEMDIKGFIEL